MIWECFLSGQYSGKYFLRSPNSKPNILFDELQHTSITVRCILGWFWELDAGIIACAYDHQKTFQFHRLPIKYFPPKTAWFCNRIKKIAGRNWLLKLENRIFTRLVVDNPPSPLAAYFCGSHFYSETSGEKQISSFLRGANTWLVDLDWKMVEFSCCTWHPMCKYINSRKTRLNLAFRASDKKMVFCRKKCVEKWEGLIVSRGEGGVAIRSGGDYFWHLLKTWFSWQSADFFVNLQTHCFRFKNSIFTTIKFSKTEVQNSSWQDHLLMYINRVTRNAGLILPSFVLKLAF